MHTSFASLRLHVSAFTALVASTACLSPCPTGPAATAADASGATSGSGASVSTGTASASSAGTPVPVGGKVLWDGDDVGGNAKSWADCDSKPDCKSAAALAPGAGRNGGMGIKFEAEGPKWIGFGWNLFGWWPPDSGYDTSNAKFFTFWMRAEAEKPDMLPEIGSLNVSLVSSGEGENRNSANGELKKFGGDNLLDGEWHEIKVPMEVLNGDKKSVNYNPGKVWEFTIGTWSPMPKKFTLYFDDVALQ